MVGIIKPHVICLPMQRYFMQLAYVGTNYAGWQRQLNALTVQQVVVEALSKLLATPTEVVASGRTDAGVHATCQVAHFSIAAPALPNRFVYRLNRMLPAAISCLWVQAVVPDAHARFSAIKRGYRYRQLACKDPFRFGQVAHAWPAPDLDLMNLAAKPLHGDHVFRSFAKQMPDEKHYRCLLHQCQWYQEGDEQVLTIEANRFLRGMVRALVGGMVQVGQGNKPVEWLCQVLEANKEIASASLAPPEGLYLIKVEYEPSIWMGERITL